MNTPTIPARIRFCRCGHTELEHFAGNDPPFHTTDCRRCDCTHFHTTTYKQRVTTLRTAATQMRGKPLQQRLFREDTT